MAVSLTAATSRNSLVADIEAEAELEIDHLHRNARRTAAKAIVQGPSLKTQKHL